MRTRNDLCDQAALLGHELERAHVLSKEQDLSEMDEGEIEHLTEMHNDHLKKKMQAKAKKRAGM